LSFIAFYAQTRGQGPALMFQLTCPRGSWYRIDFKVPGTTQRCD
jgi:hypothetical protein